MHYTSKNQGQRNYLKLCVLLVLKIIRPTVKLFAQSDFWFNFYRGFWLFLSHFVLKKSPKITKNLREKQVVVVELVEVVEAVEAVAAVVSICCSISIVSSIISSSIIGSISSIFSNNYSSSSSSIHIRSISNKSGGTSTFSSRSSTFSSSTSTFSSSRVLGHRRQTARVSECLVNPVLQSDTFKLCNITNLYHRLGATDRSKQCFGLWKYLLLDFKCF